MNIIEEWQKVLQQDKINRALLDQLLQRDTSNKAEMVTIIIYFS